MKIVFLGTAAAEGIPAVFCQCPVCKQAWTNKGKDIRTRASVLIDEEFKIDFGPDSYIQSLRSNHSLSKLKHLLITHTHQDHFYPEELCMNHYPFVASEPSIINVYGCAEVGNMLQKQDLGSTVAFHELKLWEPVIIEDATVTPLEATHFCTGQPFVYLFQRRGVTLFYGLDSGFYAEEVWSFLQDYKIDIAILDSTSGKHRRTGVMEHMGVPNIIDVKERMIKEGIATDKTVFVATHFSHNGGLTHQKLEDILTLAGFQVAYDGMELAVE